MEIREIVRIALERFKSFKGEDSRTPAFQLIDAILDITKEDYIDLMIPFINEKVIPSEMAFVNPEDSLVDHLEKMALIHQ